MQINKNTEFCISSHYKLYSQQCFEDLVSIAGVLKQDQRLLEAFACGKSGNVMFRL